MFRRSYSTLSKQNLQEQKRLYDAIIIGAGLSGLQAAYTLKQHSVTNILVLEANNRLGGRIQSIQNPKINNNDNSMVVVELGAAFIGPGQHRMFRHIENFDLEIVETAKGSAANENGKYKQGAVARLVADNGTIFDWDLTKSDRPGSSNFIVKSDINNVLRELEDMMKVVDVVNPKAAKPPSSDDRESSGATHDDPFNTQPQMNRLNFDFDKITVSEFVKDTARTVCGANYLLANFRVLLTQDPDQVSLLTLLWFLKCAGGFDALMNGEMWKMKKGNSELINRLAQDIEIRTNSPVRGIKLVEDENIIQVTTQAGDDETITDEHAKHVIFAIPPPQIRRINFTPELPLERRIQLDSFKMGNCIKTFTFFEEPFWFKNNYNGRVLVHSCSPPSYDSFERYPSCDVYDVGNNTLLGFIDASDAVYWSAKTKDERREALLKQYRRMFQTKTVPKTIDYVEKIWVDEPFIGGAFFGLPSSKTLSVYGRVWREPLFNNKIFFGGTESADNWSGYMEGAAEAGERCAMSVLRQLTNSSQGSTENPQEESQQHETHIPKPSGGKREWPDPVKTKISQDAPSPDYLRKMSKFAVTLFVCYFLFFEVYDLLMAETAEMRERDVMSRQMQRDEQMMMRRMMSVQQQQKQQQKQQEKS